MIISKNVLNQVYVVSLNYLESKHDDEKRYFRKTLEYNFRFLRYLPQFANAKLSLSSHTLLKYLTGVEFTFLKKNEKITLLDSSRVKVSNFLRYEHMTPISELINSIEKYYLEGSYNIEKLENIIMKMKVVFITHDEDIMLNKLGYKSKRPDPIKAYQEAGIEIFEV